MKIELEKCDIYKCDIFYVDECWNLEHYHIVNVCTYLCIFYLYICTITSTTYCTQSLKCGTIRTAVSYCTTHAFGGLACIITECSSHPESRHSREMIKWRAGQPGKQKENSFMFLFYFIETNEKGFFFWNTWTISIDGETVQRTKGRMKKDFIAMRRK